MSEEPHLIGGRYELAGLLGRGGMAEVREGRDIRLGRTVAIKRLRTDLASDPTFQARFKREAQSAASLNHPTIVAVYDTGEEQLDGLTVPYIVMEHVEGQTLRDVLRSGADLLPERALEIVAGVLRALSYSHHAGIVHRDIKPANVMLTPNGEVKVMDFGIARAIADTSATVTQTAAVIGTAQYLSPEQARGAQVDARSDLYSTGCLLYELLTERPPFVGDSPVSVAYQHVREEPQPPSSINPSLSSTVDAVVLRALAKSPDDRYQSADDMRDDVERVMRGERTSATATVVAPQATQMFPATPPPVPRSQVGYAPVRTERRRVEEVYDDDDRRSGTGWVIGILAVILLAALGFIGFQLLGSGDEEPPPTDVTTSELTQIVGMTEDAAAQALAADGFVLTRPCTPQPDDTIPAGEIIAQDPEARTESEPETAVICTISSGPEAPDEVTVPPLTNLTQEQAEAAIVGANLTVGDVDPQDGPGEAGQVLSSTPAEGETVEPESEVDLVVSSGQNAVPAVVDLAQAEAEQTLRDAGFNPVVEQQETADAEPGTVVAQDPAAEVPRDVGSDVTITVAVAPEPEPVPVPDVSNDNLTFSDASSQLQDAGFTEITISGQSDQPCRNNPPDQCRVVAQNPAGGTEVDDPAATPVELRLEQQEETTNRSPLATPMTTLTWSLVPLRGVHAT